MSLKGNKNDLNELLTTVTVYVMVKRISCEIFGCWLISPGTYYKGKILHRVY